MIHHYSLLFCHFPDCRVQFYTPSGFLKESNQNNNTRFSFYDNDKNDELSIYT